MSVVPTYALYGEFLESEAPDFLHFETIRERSQKHDWSIEPHKHASLCQIFLFRSTEVQVHLVNQYKISISGLTGLFIPPPIVHGFQFNEAVDGCVLSINNNLIASAVKRLSMPDSWIDQFLIVENDTSLLQAIDTICNRIEYEFKSLKPYRNTSLKALFDDLLIQFARAAPETSDTSKIVPLTRHEERVRQFCNLLETNFRSNAGVRFYAEKLNVTPVHLTRSCRSVLDKTPNELIMSRKLLEAKRMLKYTQRSVQTIADEMQFNNIGYFSRFFKRHTGSSPSDYRNNYR